jgi:hypothetical protein
MTTKTGLDIGSHINGAVSGARSASARLRSYLVLGLTRVSRFQLIWPARAQRNPSLLAA